MPRLTHAPLTRERIVTAALALLDEGGLAGLTTRRLADALSVRQPALYWHFRDARALLDAVADAMLSPEDWPDYDGSLSPQEWLAGRAHAFRRALLAPATARWSTRARGPTLQQRGVWSGSFRH